MVRRPPATDGIVVGKLILDTEGHRPRRAASWSAMAVRAVAQRKLGNGAVVGAK